MGMLNKDQRNVTAYPFIGIFPFRQRELFEIAVTPILIISRKRLTFNNTNMIRIMHRFDISRINMKN